MHPEHPDDCAVSLIDAYLDHLDHLGRSPHTIRHRRIVLGRADRELPYGLESTTGPELCEWLLSHPEPATLASYRAVLVGAYGFWCDARDPWLEGPNPADWLPQLPQPEHAPRPCTDDQLRHILTRAPGPVRLMAILAAYQGLRCCEIAGLDREHVTAAVLLVRRGKGGRPRKHATDPRVWDAVRDLPAGPVVRDADGGRLDALAVTRRFARWCDDNDLPEVTAHRLRHWFGSTLQAGQGDIRKTQQALGHRSVTSTQRYTLVTLDQERAAHAVLPTLGPAPAG